MKEYKVVSTEDKRIFPEKKGWTEWTTEEKLDQLESHLNALAVEGWTVVGSSAGGYASLFKTLVILERDKQ